MRLVLLLCAWLLSSGIAAEQANATPNVVVSVKPVHALVGGVMFGVRRPELLIPADQSPHGFALRPSDVLKLREADIVFWVGSEYETSLSRAIINRQASSTSYSIMHIEGINLLPVRTDWSAKHLHAPDHEHSSWTDPHVWLNPHNAQVIIRFVADMLSSYDPPNRAVYQTNAAAMLKRLQLVDTQIKSLLYPVRDVPYMVTHDAYQYFEKHYGLQAVNTLRTNPSLPPGAKRLSEIREMIGSSGVQCIFSEPQFSSAYITSIADDTGVRHVQLDPLGIQLDDNQDDYFELLYKLADGFIQCLSQR